MYTLFILVSTKTLKVQSDLFTKLLSPLKNMLNMLQNALHWKQNFDKACRFHLKYRNWQFDQDLCAVHLNYL